MKKEMLKQIIRDFHVMPALELHDRDLKLPAGTGKIVTLVGPRRSGKTSLLFTLMGQLLSRGVPQTSILYLNFEDERLNLATAELDLILQAFLELYPLGKLESCHLFFDEIQNVAGWDRFIRRLYDTASRNIYITGSNAKLLSSEITTSLRGRTVSYEVLPLSFKEYLRFRGISPDRYSSRSQAQVNSELERYLQTGGFPEVIGYDEPFRNQVLQEYFNVMIYRDLLERYEIGNLAALKFFLKRLCSTATKSVSINAIFNELKSAGFKVGKNQLYDWLDACQAVYLAFVLKKLTASTTERELGEKKLYAVDNGLLNAISYRFSEDRGKALEQAVFLELRRRRHELFFFKGKAECDFVVKQSAQVTAAIQVCVSLDDAATRRRELRGLAECCHAFGLTEGTIVTAGGNQELEHDGVQVRVVPLAWWLLEEGVEG